MDNAQKAIMIGVGLFITIIIIAAVMLITGMGQDLLNSGTTQVSGISSQLQQQLTDGYDDVSMTGAQALSGVKKYYNDPKLGVYFKSKSGTSNWTTPTTFGTLTAPTSTNKFYATSTVAAKNTKQPSMGELTTPGNASYIPTTAQFKSYLIKMNDAIVGIVFEQQP